MSDTDYHDLLARALAANDAPELAPVIGKELLYYDILYALDRSSLLDHLVFQGGTSLRLCYGSQRFSEDLDFAGGVAFGAADAERVGDCIAFYIERRYGLDVRVREPKRLGVAADRKTHDGTGVAVDTWQISVQTAPRRKDLPGQRIKLEIASVPAHTVVNRPLQVNYDSLPPGYHDIILPTESIQEIMADKLISLVNIDSHIRYRDIWDLAWLERQGAVPDEALIRHKITDYGIVDYAAKARRLADALPDIVASGDFRHTMARFLPASALDRTLDTPRFRGYLVDSLQDKLRTAATAAVVKTGPTLEDDEASDDDLSM